MAIYTEAAALELAGRIRAGGGSIVFTTGVFDLLNGAHLRHLQMARSLGDALIVGLESDAAVRAIAGAGRPIVPEAERAELLAALGCVDAVVISGTAGAHALVNALTPEVFLVPSASADAAVEGVVEKIRATANAEGP
jgi:rfaE bifunctional protein nucleotidyltransferase chain/domain